MALIVKHIRTGLQRMKINYNNKYLNYFMNAIADDKNPVRLII